MKRFIIDLAKHVMAFLPFIIGLTLIHRYVEFDTAVLTGLSMILGEISYNDK